MKSQNTQNKNNFIILATPAPISHRTAEENLGLGYLSAILKQNGYNVKILDAWLNGWSTEIPYISNVMQSYFPNAKLSSENKMASVGLGLAYDAMRRFCQKNR